MYTISMSTTIRVSEATRDKFATLAKSTGKPMTDLLDRAASMLERELFFSSFQRGYEKLNDDADTWNEIVAERDLEENVLDDAAR